MLVLSSFLGRSASQGPLEDSLKVAPNQPDGDPSRIATRLHPSATAKDKYTGTYLWNSVETA